MFWVKVYKDRGTEENNLSSQITEYHTCSETGSFYWADFITNIKKQEDWYKRINKFSGCRDRK